MTTTEALQLIATPMRQDGTWNRDREACRQIAADALASMTTDPTAALKLARDALSAIVGSTVRPTTPSDGAALNAARAAIAAIDALPAPSAPTGESQEHMLQDMDRGLSRWLSNQPGARLHATEAAAAIAQASAPSGEPAAWMDPNAPREPIGAAKKRDMETINGAPGRALAAKYTIPLYTTPQAAPAPQAEPVMTQREAVCIMSINTAIRRIQAGAADRAVEPLQRAALLFAAQAAPAAQAAASPEPTAEQRQAGARAWMEAIADPDMSPADKVAHVYRAMLGALPAPSGEPAADQLDAALWLCQIADAIGLPADDPALLVSAVRTAMRAAHTTVPQASTAAAAPEPVADPVAYGLFALVAGVWTLQHPVRFSRGDADSDRAMYQDGTRLEVRPLYTRPAPAVAAPVQPLTDDRLDELRQADTGALNFVTLRQFRAVARSVERALGITATTAKE